MTEIERKALALIAEIKAERGLSGPDYLSARAALIRAIEQHEAFRQEVSDAVERAIDDCGHDGMRKAHISSRLARFIITKPADPLVEALNELDWCAPEKASDLLRAALAARGLKIVEVE